MRPNIGLLIKDPWCMLAFGFGSGLSPKAPGTAGTLAALPLWLVMVHLMAKSWLMLLIVCSFLLGIKICQAASDRLGVHDHGGIVWDEFVGLWITLWFLPASWAGLIVGFCCFRLFDILKPWPIKWLDQRIHGGFGIMLDDAVAAIPAILLSLLILSFF